MRDLVAQAFGLSLMLAAVGAVVSVAGLVVESKGLTQAGAWMTAPVLVLWAILMAGMAIGLAANVVVWVADRLRAHFSRD